MLKKKKLKPLLRDGNTNKHVLTKLTLLPVSKYFNFENRKKFFIRFVNFTKPHDTDMYNPHRFRAVKNVRITVNYTCYATYSTTRPV